MSSIKLEVVLRNADRNGEITKLYEEFREARTKLIDALNGQELETRLMTSQGITILDESNNPLT